MFERIIKSFDLKDAGSVVFIHGNLKEEFFLTSSDVDDYKNSKKSIFSFLFWNYGVENKKDVLFYNKHNKAFCVDQDAFNLLWNKINKKESATKPTNLPEEIKEYKKRKIAHSIWKEIDQNQFISSVNEISNLFRITQVGPDIAFASFVQDLSTLLDDSSFKDTFIFISEFRTIFKSEKTQTLLDFSNILSEFSKLTDRGVKFFIDLECQNINCEDEIFTTLPTLKYFLENDSLVTSSKSKLDATLYIGTPNKNELTVFTRKFADENYMKEWDAMTIEKFVRFMLSMNQDLKKWESIFTELKARKEFNKEDPKSGASLKALKHIMLDWSKDNKRFGNISLDDRLPLDRLKNDFVGVEIIATSIEKMIKTCEAGATDKVLTDGFRMHMAFLGNPGTGKTTIARLVGEIFQEKGLLSKGHFIEAKADDFIAGYVGQTAIKTAEKCEEALGGVLFIDEAYGISQNEFGKEAIATLLQYMENHRDDFCVIMAGYTNEMKNFIKVNPGLTSRIPQNNRLVFKDYNALELNKIFERGLKKKIGEQNITPGIFDFSEFVFEEKIRGRESATDPRMWGNARIAEELIQELITNAVSRTENSTNSRCIITLDDFSDDNYGVIKKKFKQENTLFNEESKPVDALDEIRRMGQITVFSEIEKYIATMEVAKKNQHDTSDYRPHIVLTGNPGTGKTTLARKLGRLLREKGILEASGNFIECKREDLIAIPAENLKDKFQESIGGVLFIDEAYALTENEDARGREIVNQLLTFMENHRHEVVVVLAGYTNDMRRFLDSNPGLRRRIRQEINIPDFDPDKLLGIFNKKMTELSDIKIDSELEKVLPSIFEYMYRFRNSSFGNAGEVEKFKNAIYENWALRTHKLAVDPKNGIWTLADLPIEYKEKFTNIQDEKVLDQIMSDIHTYYASTDFIRFCEEVSIELEFNKIRMSITNKVASSPLRFVWRNNGSIDIQQAINLFTKLLMYHGAIKRTPIDQAIATTNFTDLMGQYVGQTIPKVNDFYQSCSGKVLVLSNVSQFTKRGGDSQSSFLGEVLSASFSNINELSEKIVCILLDDSKNLDSFLTEQPLWSTIFINSVRFEKPGADEIASTIVKKLKENNYRFDDAISVNLKDIVTKQTENGEFDANQVTEKMYQSIKTKANKRIINLYKNDSSLDESTIQTILIEDLN